jgi:hypothetical protein
MHGLILEPVLAEALAALAREQRLVVIGGRHFGNGDTMIGFARADGPPGVAALLPIDHTLRGRLAEVRAAPALRRLLREDGFTDAVECDDARDLCRLGLVGCHALSEVLPADRVAAGLRMRVLYDSGAVEVRTEATPTARVEIAADLVRLLAQFHAAERFARAYHACVAQLSRLGV